MMNANIRKFAPLGLVAVVAIGTVAALDVWRADASAADGFAAQPQGACVEWPVGGITAAAEPNAAGWNACRAGEPKLAMQLGMASAIVYRANYDVAYAEGVRFAADQERLLQAHYERLAEDGDRAESERAFVQSIPSVLTNAHATGPRGGPALATTGRDEGWLGATADQFSDFAKDVGIGFEGARSGSGDYARTHM